MSRGIVIFPTGGLLISLSLLKFRRLWALRIKRKLREYSNRASGVPEIAGATLSLEELRDIVGADAQEILEIGANDGLDTNRLLRFFGEARIHCFEPDPRAAQAFLSNVSDNRAHLDMLAVGSYTGEAVFHASGGSPQGGTGAWDKSGSLKPPKNHLLAVPWCTFEESFNVSLITLDEWFRLSGIGRIDLLWMDVQGAEDEVIAGGTFALANTKFIFTEYSDLELYKGQKSLRQLMRLLPGWEIVRRLSNDVLLRNTRVQ